MGAIQSSLNQLFASTLGAAFVISQNPSTKQKVADRAELKKLQREAELEAGVTKAAQHTVGDVPASVAKGAVNGEGAPMYSPKTLTDVAEQELRTLEAEKAVEGQKARMGKGNPANVFALNQQMREQQGTISRLQSSVEQKQGVKNAVKERRSFIKAMQGQRVSFGDKGGDSTFGELPTEIQRQIAAQYSKAERKKVMDEYYGKE